MEGKHRLIRQRVKGERRYVERREVALEDRMYSIGPSEEAENELSIKDKLVGWEDRRERMKELERMCWRKPEKEM